MGNLLKLFAISALLSMGSGCVQKNVLDDIVLINGIGFDYVEGQKIQGTVVYPVYLPDQPPKNKTYTAKAEIKKTILQDISRKATDPVVTGSLNLIIFSDELAEKEGILELVDAFQRDPSVGSSLYVAVVNGSAKEFLKTNFGIRSTGEHISRLMKHNIRNDDMPKTNLQRFLFDYYQEGKTPFMPHIKKAADNTAELDGISLFKHGKVIDFIPQEKMFFFKLLVDKYSEGLYGVETDKGEAAVRSIRSKNKFILLQRKPFKIRVEINVNGVIDEFTGNELGPDTIKMVEKQFEEVITEECMKMFQRFKEKKVDPAGFGHFLKTQIRNFNMNDWHESGYDELSVEIKPTVKITQSGVIK